MRYFVTFFLLLVINLNSAGAFHLSEIYIEARGNNKFEAKMRAQNMGSVRAFFLYANKMGFTNDDFSQITYRDVAPTITGTRYLNENMTDNSYSALADYNLNRQAVTEVLYNFATSDSYSKFYECLVLPVMKVGKNLHIWDNKIKWLNSWGTHKEFLAQNQILLLEQNNIYKDHISPALINKITYEDFDLVFPETPIKKFLVIVAEYFTNLDNGGAYLQVEYREIKPGAVSSIVKKYDLNSTNNPESTFSDIIERFASENGVRIPVKRNSVENFFEVEKNLFLKQRLHSVTMNILVDDVRQWDRIKSKLDKITEIEKIIIKDQSENNYVVEMKYKNNLESLTKALFEAGMTYTTNKNQYYLTETNDGI